MEYGRKLPFLKLSEHSLRFGQAVAWLMVVALFPLSSPISCQVYLTRDQALALHFPDSKIERKTLFLTDAQAEQIQTSSKSKLNSKIVAYYVSSKNDGIDGYAFFESEIIRTQKAAFMVALNATGSVIAVEILTFLEPKDYLPPSRWLRQFNDKSGDDDLYLKRGIPSISGATISAQVLSEGVRRCLAIHKIVSTKE